MKVVQKITKDNQVVDLETWKGKVNLVIENGYICLYREGQLLAEYGVDMFYGKLSLVIDHE